MLPTKSLGETPSCLVQLLVALVFLGLWPHGSHVHWSSHAFSSLSYEDSCHWI